MEKYIFAVFFTILAVIVGKLKSGMCTVILLLLVLVHTDKYSIIVFTITCIVFYFLLTVFTIGNDQKANDGDKIRDTR